MQQDEYFPVVTKDSSPLWRGITEPQRLQAKTTFTEHKTALVHQSSKQYRGEFLIFLNCRLETIHHPLLKLSRGGWVTSRDSRFMCKLWWEHVYRCATCARYHSFLVSKQSGRIMKRRWDVHTWNALTLHSRPAKQSECYCVNTHSRVCEQRGEGKNLRVKGWGMTRAPRLPTVHCD